MSFIVDAVSKSAAGKSQGRRIGKYWTYAEAVGAAQRLIDNFLFQELKEGAGRGITAAILLNHYRRKGETPVILLSTEALTVVPRFDPMKYAAQRCVELFASLKKK